MGNEKKDLLVLSIHRKGTPEFPRYVISDQYLRYWTQTGWDESEKGAILYTDPNVACQQMQELLLAEYADLPCREYRAPVYIKLFCREKVTRLALMRWLVKVARLLIDQPQHGNGPVHESLGLCRIEWGELEEVGPCKR